MPGEIIAELVLRPIAEAMLQVLGYLTGRLVIPLISLGRIKVEPAPKGTRVIPRWHGFGRTETGAMIVNEEMAALLGLLFWIAGGLLTALWFLTMR